MRSSPSGIYVPVAVLSMSAPVAITSGVLLHVPFDVLSFEQGDPGSVPSPPVTGVSFGVGPGLWLAQAQFTVGVSQTTILAALTIQSGSQVDAASSKVAAATSDQLVCTSLQRRSFTALSPGHVFAGIGLDVTATGTTSTIAAKLTIFQLDSLT
jgi:hypothetical protein